MRSKSTIVVSGGSEYGSARWVRAVGETLLWWVFTDAVWLASVTSVTRSELMVATACTLPCGVLALMARRANRGYWRFRVGWLTWGVIVARDVVVQTVQAWLYALIPRRRRAVLTVVPLRAEDERVAAGRRAISTLSLATTPGTVVCDSDARLDRLLLHRLGQRQGRLESAVQQ
jgi:multisubunit Na+/H+ antiporter MnhE subunit